MTFRVSSVKWYLHRIIQQIETLWELSYHCDKATQVVRSGTFVKFVSRQTKNITQNKPTCTLDGEVILFSKLHTAGSNYSERVVGRTFQELNLENSEVPSLYDFAVASIDSSKQYVLIMFSVHCAASQLMSCHSGWCWTAKMLASG